MESDVAKRCVILEGFPQTSQPKTDMATFLVTVLGVQHVQRIHRSTQLTTSNTPNWIVFCNSEQDARKCTGTISYPHQGTTVLLKGRLCSIDELPDEFKGLVPGQVDSMVSIGKDIESMMSVDAGLREDGDAPGDDVGELENLNHNLLEGQNPSGDFVSVNPPQFNVDPGQQFHPSVHLGQGNQPYVQRGQGNQPYDHFRQGYQHNAHHVQGYQYPEQMYQFGAYMPWQLPHPNFPAQSPSAYLGNPVCYRMPHQIIPNQTLSYQGQPNHKPYQPGFLHDARQQPHRSVPPPSLTCDHSTSSSQITDHQEMQHSHSAPLLKVQYSEFDLEPPALGEGGIIEVHGCDVSSNGSDKYRYFFENSRRGGGEIEKFDVSEDNILIIRFKDPSVAHKLVVEGKAKVGETEVIIKQHIPPPLYKNKVLLEYPGAHLDQSSHDLTYYIEARSQGILTNRETGSKPNVILLTFDDPVDTQKLQSACRSRPFNKRLVNVVEVPATRILHVQGVPNTVSTDTLRNYFETRKSGNKTNCEVTFVDDLEENGAYLVHFADFHAVRNITEVKHTLGNHQLQVGLHHKCIGLSSSRLLPPPRTETPKGMSTIIDVDSLIVRFLKKSPSMMSEINRQARDQNMVLSINVEGKLCATRTQTLVESDANTKEEFARMCLSILDDNIAYHSLCVPIDLKDKVQSMIEKIVPDATDVKCYTDRSTVAIVGSKRHATEIKEKMEVLLRTEAKQTPIVTEQTTTGIKQMKVGKQQTKEITQKKFVSHKVKPLESGLLLAMDFAEDARKVYPEVNVTVNSDSNEVHFEGPEETMTDVKLKMLEIISSAETVEIQTISEQQAAFMQNAVVRKEVISRLKENGIIAAWITKQSTVEVIARTKSDAEETSKKISATVIERICPTGNNMLSLLSSESWESLQTHLMSVFPDRFIITNIQNENYLSIVGLDDVVDNVYETVSTFFAANVLEKTVVDVKRGVYRFIKTHLCKQVEEIAKDLKDFHVQITQRADESRFIVLGSEEGIRTCKLRLDGLTSRVITRKEILEKVGMAKMLKSEKGSMMINHVEQQERCTVEIGTDERPDVSSSTTTKAEPVTTIIAVTNLAEGRKICIREGDITSVRVGAIVNAANKRLDHCGGLAKAIVDKGGNIIQEECKKYIMTHGQLLDGGAVMSGPGNLPCDVIIHAVGPHWDGGNNREKDYLREATIRSMELAESKQCVSVAIPGLSTGIYGYPTDAATEIITTAVRDYFRQNSDSVIKHVYFCDSNRNTINGFVKALKSVFGQDNVQVQPQQGGGAKKGQVRPRFVSHSMPTGDVLLVEGQIAKQKVDVIVNSTNQTLQLKEAGAVSKSLLEAAGPELQSDCSRYRGGITPGSVVVTRGGKLQCKRVYHVFLPQFTSDEQAQKDIKDLVTKCLTSAAPHKISSMAFPALGTGGLKYPRELVAACMFKAINDFWLRNPRFTKDVRIVLYEKDQETITAFEKVKGKLGQDGGSHQSTLKRFPRKPDLVRGSIVRFKADVIVNPTDYGLNLTRGRLSSSISEAAGPGLNLEAKSKYPNGVPHCGLAVTSAGLLNASEIFHVVIMNRHQVQAMQHLTNAVTTCLEEGDRSKHTSILFPTLGIGIPGYEKDLAAKAMYQAIDEFWTKHPGTTLTQIKIVIYEKDDDVAKVFKHERIQFYQIQDGARKDRELKGTFKQSPMHYEEPVYDIRNGVTFGNIQFTLLQGDLLQEQVDCIINNAHSHFDLNYGLINQALLQKFGDSVHSKDPQKVADLKNRGIAVTEVSGAPFNKIIHYEEFFFKHDVSKILKKCIKEADKIGCFSVALPALGQGPRGGVPEHRFLQYLYDTLKGLSNLKNVTEVHLVVFEKPMFQRFTALLENLVETQGLKKRTFFKKTKAEFKEAFSTHDPIPRQFPSRPRHVSEHTENGLEVSFFSDTQEGIQNAVQRLFDAYDKEFDSQSVLIEALKKLSDAKLQKLHMEAQQHGVAIDMNQRLGRIEVRGIKDDTAAMLRRVYEICLEHKDEENAEILGSVVQWYFMDMLEDEELVKYDTETNKAIEKAYRENKESHVLEDTDGVKYIVDFVDLVEYREDDHSAKCPLIRKDLIQAAVFDPPLTWMDMGADNMKVIRVNPNSGEYRRISAKFASTNKQIVKLERIQNKTLLKQYQAKKQLFGQRAMSAQCERELWHGTATDAIHSINKDGFNRSYCGKNAVAFGNGVYFAVNASYSTQDRYARPDPMGNKYIYLVDVLTGEYAKGRSGMRVPPPVNSADPSVLCDSVVDDVNNPSMFVIFNDTQAYPKYLITFK